MNRNLRFAAFGRAMLMTVGIMLILTVSARVYAGHLQMWQPEVTAQPVQISPVKIPTPGEKFATAKMLQSDDAFGEQVQRRFSGQVVNLLLVGRDADGNTGTRADTIMLCTFNKQKQTITLTSFLRDLYVKIPGYGKDRINAAYHFGGVQLLEQTLRENFGIQIDGSVLVDFEHFEQIIDLLGGVELELTKAEAAFINRHLSGSNLTAGMQLLSGKQALTYARNRYDRDGDFSRTNRQRKLLNVLIQTYKDKSLPQMLQLVKAIASMVKTDLSKADLTGYALSFFPMLSTAEIRTQAIPVEGGFSYSTIDGKAVLVPDMQKNKQVLEDTLS